MEIHNRPIHSLWGKQVLNARPARNPGELGHLLCLSSELLTGLLWEEGLGRSTPMVPRAAVALRSRPSSMLLFSRCGLMQSRSGASQQCQPATSWRLSLPCGPPCPEHSTEVGATATLSSPARGGGRVRVCRESRVACAVVTVVNS